MRVKGMALNFQILYCARPEEEQEPFVQVWKSAEISLTFPPVLLFVSNKTPNWAHVEELWVHRQNGKAISEETVLICLARAWEC